MHKPKSHTREYINIKISNQKHKVIEITGPKVMRVAMVDLTVLGSKTIKEWLGFDSHRRSFACPFNGNCEVCQAIFVYYYKVLVNACPCYHYGEQSCEMVGRRLLKYNSTFSRFIRRVINYWRKHIHDNRAPVRN